MYPNGKKNTSGRLNYWGTCTKIIQSSLILYRTKINLTWTRSKNSMNSGWRERIINLKITRIDLRLSLSTSVSNTRRWAVAKSLHVSLFTLSTPSTPHFGSTSFRGAVYSSLTVCHTSTTITTTRKMQEIFRHFRPIAVKTKPIAESSSWATTKGK